MTQTGSVRIWKEDSDSPHFVLEPSYLGILDTDASPLPWPQSDAAPRPTLRLSKEVDIYSETLRWAFSKGWHISQGTLTLTWLRSTLSGSREGIWVSS